MIKQLRFNHVYKDVCTTIMKNVLVLTPNLNLPGGVAHYYKTLMLDANKNIAYFSINNGKQEGSISKLIGLLIKYYQFVKKIIHERYEVIVVNPSLDEGRSFYRDFLFILISRVLNRKVIVFFRGWLESCEIKIKASKWKSFLFGISYAKASEFIVLGNIFKLKLIELGVSPNKRFFIETTVADSKYLNELDISGKHSTFQTEINFLFLSRIEINKGIFIAIDAFKGFLERYPGARSRLIIAGDGPDLQIAKRYVEKENIPFIHFLGYVSADEKRKILRECHIILFPSYTEGLPNCILEGMLYGMPVISRATGGIPEIIEQNKNGFLTESFLPNVFTQFLGILALDRELYVKMSMNNHRKAIENFSSEKVRERVLKIYDSM